MDNNLLSGIVNTLKSQSPQQSTFKFDPSKLELLKKRLPNLEDSKLQLLSCLYQVIDMSELSNSELMILANSNLEQLEYSGETISIDKVFNCDNPAFDLGGIVLSEDFDRSKLALAFKKALATNKSLSQSFILNYITSVS